MATEAGTSRMGDPGLHNKNLDCRSSEVYATGTDSEEEEICWIIHVFKIVFVCSRWISLDNQNSAVLLSHGSICNK